MVMRLRGLFLALSASSWSACSAPRDMGAVAGTYVMHQKWAADTIRLRPNGRYVRTYNKEHEAAATDSGRWFLSRNRSA